MARYHINPSNGEVGACRAQKGNCPFTTANEHYDSKDEARVAYEEIMASGKEPLSWMISQKGETIKGPEDILAFTKACYDEAIKLKESLTEDEIDALRVYAMAGFEVTNSLLRGTPVAKGSDSFYTRYPEHLEWLIEDNRRRIPVMKEIFERLPEQPRVLYRYSSPVDRPIKEFLDEIKEKGEYRDDAFMSTSANVDYPLFKALTDKSEARFLIEVVVRKSIPLQPDEAPRVGDIQSLENEYLINAGTQFDVVGVEYRKPVSFGSMKEILIKDHFVGSRDPISKVYSNNDFRIPVLKLVERA